MQRKQKISEIAIVILYILSFVGVRMMSEQEVSITVCTARSESIFQGSILSFHIVEAGLLLVLPSCVLQLVLKLPELILSDHHLHIALGIVQLKVQSHSDFLKHAYYGLSSSPQGAEQHFYPLTHLTSSMFSFDRFLIMILLTWQFKNYKANSYC